MNLNRARKDSAVSPVIAVVLMVAITVVMAAAVYVWVSGFSGSGTTSPGTLGLSQTERIGALATLQVSTASPNTLWNQLVFKVDGAALSYNASLPAGSYCVYAAGACSASLPAGAAGAGSLIRVNAPAGSTLVAVQGDSILTTLLLH